jgi:hypothetical protein
MRFSIDSAEALKNTQPQMPAGFENRLGDNWRLMFAVAEGGEVAGARRAAVRG